MSGRDCKKCDRLMAGEGAECSASFELLGGALFLMAKRPSSQMQKGTPY